jgi:Zn-dependent peptidase ImmA (M78 family)
MLPTLNYPHTRAGACAVTEAAGIWAVAGQLRRQLTEKAATSILSPDVLRRLCRHLHINGRDVAIDWDFDHAVHDDQGAPVFGICEVDAESADTAFVSINGPHIKDRADLLLSTAGHELGHVVFDVPAVLAAPPTSRRYRSFTSAPACLHRGRSSSEWRANEFMGALLAPPFQLHRELLRHARSEDMTLVRGPHSGRPTWPVIARNNDPDVLAGVIDVLGQEFGVSPRFIEVRLQRYGLISKEKGRVS